MIFNLTLCWNWGPCRWKFVDAAHIGTANDLIFSILWFLDTVQRWTDIFISVIFYSVEFCVHAAEETCFNKELTERPELQTVNPNAHSFKNSTLILLIPTDSCDLFYLYPVFHLHHSSSWLCLTATAKLFKPPGIPSSFISLCKLFDLCAMLDASTCKI